MKEALIIPQLELREKDRSIVDSVIGRRKKESPHQTANVDWSNCGLAQAYPDWDDFHIQLEEERVAAKREGRDPHPAADEPMKRVGRIAPDPTPWGDGPTVGDVNKEYETTHRGR